MGVFSRRKAQTAQQSSSPRAVVSSAAQESLSSRASNEAHVNRRRESERWQSAAWTAYDEIGEVAYAVDLLANVAAKVELHPFVTPEGENHYRKLTEVPDLTPGIAKAASLAMSMLRPAHGSLQDLVRAIVANWTISGECYLVRTPALLGSETKRSWDIRSVDEIEVSGEKAFLKRDQRGALGKTYLDESAGYYVARLWVPHPRFSTLPHAPMRGVLDLCEELQLINTTFRATARSRLNSGLLFVPDTLTVTGVQGYEDTAGEVDDEFESFESELLNSMVTPIQDETSAAAVVPLVVRGPAEAGDQIKYIKFERSFDEQLKERADRVLERILQGMNLPKDVVSGLANVRYSNAIVIEESLYKQHIEPLIQQVCVALTTAYLRPTLESMGFSPEQASRISVWFDPSSVVAAQNITQTTQYAYDKLLISDDAWRHYNGFDDTDAPDGEEIARRIAFQKGQVLPEYLDSVLQTLAPAQTEAVKEQVAAENPETSLPPEIIQALTGKPTGTVPEQPQETPPISDTDTPPAKPGTEESRPQ